MPEATNQCLPVSLSVCLSLSLTSFLPLSLKSNGKKCPQVVRINQKKKKIRQDGLTGLTESLKEEVPIVTKAMCWELSENRASHSDYRQEAIRKAP